MRICRYLGCKKKLANGNKGVICFAHKREYRKSVDKKIEDLKNELTRKHILPRRKAELRKSIKKLVLLDI